MPVNQYIFIMNPFIVLSCVTRFNSLRLKMKYLVLVLGFILNTVTYAETIMPNGCHALSFEDQSVTLTSAKPTLFMIHNTSETDLWVTHTVKDPGASAGWSSRLQSGKWSALLLNQKDFELSCIESKPGHEQQVPCTGVLAVCEWSSINKLDKAKDGTYWVGENKSLKGLNAVIGQRGFKLPQAE
jgi:hypothetical protein